MPKFTSDFKGEPDYKLATNAAKGFAFIGSPDAAKKSKAGRIHPRTITMAIGAEREFVQSDCLAFYYQDMEQKKQYKDNDDKNTSLYVGSVFNPENRLGLPFGTKLADVAGEQKAYECNQAFIAGLIDSGRPVLLVTPIESYNYPTGTVFELFWLMDNGYQFEADSLFPDITIARPPHPPKAPNARIIYDYKAGTSDYKTQIEDKKTTLQAKLDVIKNIVFQSRLGLQGTAAPKAGKADINTVYDQQKSQHILKLLDESRRSFALRMIKLERILNFYASKRFAFDKIRYALFSSNRNNKANNKAEQSNPVSGEEVTPTSSSSSNSDPNAAANQNNAGTPSSALLPLNYYCPTH